MICYNCLKHFYVKRNFLTLFETKKYYICDACRKTYPMHLQIEHLPLENYGLAIVTLFDHLFQLKLESYCLEISEIVSYFIKNKPEFFLIFLEKVTLNDRMIECISFLADVEKKSILLICCELKK